MQVIALALLPFTLAFGVSNNIAAARNASSHYDHATLICSVVEQIADHNTPQIRLAIRASSKSGVLEYYSERQSRWITPRFEIGNGGFLIINSGQIAHDTSLIGPDEETISTISTRIDLHTGVLTQFATSSATGDVQKSILHGTCRET